MAAHVIWFDFYCRPGQAKLGKTAQPQWFGHYKKRILLGLMGTTHEVHNVRTAGYRSMAMEKLHMKNKLIFKDFQ